VLTAPPHPDRRDRGPQRFRLRRGLDLPIAGAADCARVEAGPPVGRVAWLGDDAPGVRPRVLVAVGDRVRLGQTLCVDRRRPEVRFAAPGAGVVTAVERGERRRIEAIAIRLEGDEAERFEPVDPASLAELPRERLRELLLASGWWPALRTRPFSRIPDPGSAPRSLFVTALASDPLAPPAERLLAERPADFALGVAALARLVECPVWVCTRPAPGLAIPALPNVAAAEFAGPHPAGLPGTHIHRIDPVGPDRTVWHVGHTDVVALGRLLATGRVDDERVVALAGPSFARPRLLRTRAGASTEDLVRGELRDEHCRVVAGSVLSGRLASGPVSFLRRADTQVCALPEDPEPRRGWRGRDGRADRGGWLIPTRGGASRDALAPFARRRRFSASLGGRRGAFFPLERLERAFPLDLPIGPLLRSLVVGDVDEALALGCLELAEEDLALATFLCPGKLDYGALLRALLDEIERAM
jgi:Na+-transporting NADH:ubiquinone oxidoreductase subunit A